MKKSLIAIGLSLSMMLAMATPVFAANPNANTNGDGGAVTLPGSPEYTASKLQATGQSFNEASISSIDGTTWKTANDDDTVKTDLDTTGADINVWAKVTDSAAKIYKVDLTWGAMKFEYKDASGQWDTTNHTYSVGADASKGWTASYLDGTNNKVGITNHSNKAINANFAYAMTGTAFNNANGLNNVIGNFFDANAKAEAAAKVLASTYADALGAVNDAAVANKLTGSTIALPTADAYNSSATTPSDGTSNVVAGARNKDVFFAFSGTPDSGKGKELDTFKKVGVITVTVTPNNEESLNRPSWTV